MFRSFLFICSIFFFFLSVAESRRAFLVQSNQEENYNVHSHHNHGEVLSEGELHGTNAATLHPPSEEQLASSEPTIDNQELPDALDEDELEAPIKLTKAKHQHEVHRKKHRSMKLRKSKARARESAWYYCADESNPKEVKVATNGKGVMCSKEYPTHTCCLHHDLTMELIGSQVAEQVPDMRCARFLMKLRCAHCSPRSWWLFHAPDQRRHPHKRVMPILCPAFCKKFHSACRDSVAGLQNDNFCEFHTSNEEGPCFPDYVIRRGTID